MSNLIKKAISLIVGSPLQSARPLRGWTERDLIRLESEIGKELFGPIPAEHRREFFCLDPHTWIWYEEWVDVETGKKRNTTTRYEVHQNGILKIQDGQPYKFVEGEELKHFAMATKLYHEQVMRGLYKIDPYTREAVTE